VINDFFNSAKIEKKIQWEFQNKELLLLAFTHRSFWNENQGKVNTHNERLEFLGDSVLGLLVADYLFSHYPGLDEGLLSSHRSQLVDAPACAAYLQKLGVETFLLLGKGEQMNTGKGRESILADLFEALMGAIYLDQGLEGARRFFFTHFNQEVVKIITTPQRNWKAELQDYTQKYYQQTPHYVVLEESGPAHCKIFHIAVWIDEKKWGEGAGASKKEGQVQAAKDALLALKKLKLK
jgi:ribonuclease III